MSLQSGEHQQVVVGNSLTATPGGKDYPDTRLLKVGYKGIWPSLTSSKKALKAELRETPQRRANSSAAASELF